MVGVMPIVGPDDFLVRRDFKNLDGVFVPLTIAGNDCISIGQSLNATCILNDPAHVFIVQFPDNLSLGTELDDPVTISAPNQSVAVFQSYRGERPMLGLGTTKMVRVGLQVGDDLSGGGVLLDRKTEQVRCQVISVGQFSGHSRLHMVVVGLFGIHSDGLGDLAIRIDLDETRLVAQYGNQSLTVW